LKFSDHEAKLQVASIGADKDATDYNPYCDTALQSFMAMRAPKTVYVAGIALEYCVLSTCLVSKAYSTNVVALEDYIRSAKADQANVAWNLLKDGGVHRIAGNPFA
jgi:nicotinamidase-related amidase